MLTARMSIFTPGPRGNLYVHPQYAGDLFRWLEVHAAYAQAGLARAKLTMINTGGHAGRGQVAHWKNVLKVLSTLSGTLHRGCSPADWAAAGAVAETRERAFMSLSPYVRSLRTKGDESAS